MSPYVQDGAVLSNAGQFAYEIDVEGMRKVQASTREARANMEEITLNNGRVVFLLGGGNLLNLSCAEGPCACATVTGCPQSSRVARRPA